MRLIFIVPQQLFQIEIGLFNFTTLLNLKTPDAIFVVLDPIGCPLLVAIDHGYFFTRGDQEILFGVPRVKLAPSHKLHHPCRRVKNGRFTFSQTAHCVKDGT